jgi:hypothetical protein
MWRFGGELRLVAARALRGRDADPEIRAELRRSGYLLLCDGCSTFVSDSASGSCGGRRETSISLSHSNRRFELRDPVARADPRCLPSIVGRPVREGQVTTIYLAPRFTTAMRMPDAINSVVLGDPESFSAEHSERESHYRLCQANHAQTGGNQSADLDGARLPGEPAAGQPW